MRLGLSLTPALLDQRLAALAAHLPRAQALRKALAAAVVLRRRVGGERLIARTARGKKSAEQSGDGERAMPGHAHELVHSLKAAGGSGAPSPVAAASNAAAGATRWPGKQSTKNLTFP